MKKYKKIAVLFFILSGFLFVNCEKENIISYEEIISFEEGKIDKDEVKVSYEVTSTGNIGVPSIEYRTAAFFLARENNPIIPWYRNTYTSEECLADPITIKAISYNAPKRTTLHLSIYFNDELVADRIFYSNGTECGGTLEYYKNK